MFLLVNIEFCFVIMLILKTIQQDLHQTNTSYHLSVAWILDGIRMFSWHVARHWRLLSFVADWRLCAILDRFHDSLGFRTSFPLLRYLQGHKSSGSQYSSGWKLALPSCVRHRHVSRLVIRVFLTKWFVNFLVDSQRTRFSVTNNWVCFSHRCSFIPSVSAEIFRWNIDCYTKEGICMSHALSTLIIE